MLAQASWVNSHQATVQKVVDALVATMHWIHTHTAAQIASAMPADFVNNGLTTKATYAAELAADKGQFLPDGMMPASGPPTALAIDKFVGNVTKPVNIAAPTPTSTPSQPTSSRATRSNATRMRGPPPATEAAPRPRPATYGTD